MQAFYLFLLNLEAILKIKKKILWFLKLPLNFLYLPLNLHA